MRTYLPSLMAMLTMAAAPMPAVSAEPAQTQAPAAPQAPEKKPPFTWGADARFRNEYFDAALSLDKDNALSEQDYFRIRTRIWGAFNLAENLSVNARVAAEPRVWMRQSFTKQHPGEGTEWRYALIDSLNLKWKAPDIPLTLTIGRQEVLLGDAGAWWLVMDGSPGDGSWTLFFDALRATFDLQDIKTRLDIIYLYQSPAPDDSLPILGSASTYSVTEQKERGIVLYASNKSLQNTQIDGYVIYKSDSRVKGFASGSEADICTFGAKIGGTPSEHWKYSVEAAWQCGNKTDGTVKVPVTAAAERDIQAYGANASLTYLLKDSLNNQFSLQYEFLSGDKPGTTGRDEMFDILWGRWPRFSELYIYSYPYETSGKVAQLNNLERIGAYWSFAPMKNMTFSAAYNLMLAPQEVPTRAMVPGLFSQDGHTRGQFWQFILRQKFNKNLSAHLWAELLKQGSFYTNRDTMVFLRGEIMFTY